MKHVSKFSRGLFLFFFVISCVGVGLLFATNDIEEGKLQMYFIYIAAVVVSIFVTVIIYDYRLMSRHLFSIACLLLLVYGCALNKHSDKYRVLYTIAIEAGSISRFYRVMLHLYDLTSKDVVTVRDFYEEKFQ